MIVRNLAHPEVQATRYRAHDGGVAHMVLDTRHLQTLMFLAQAVVPPGEKLSGHQDPMEEIYLIQSGRGMMQVGEDRQEVEAGDAIAIPIGRYHELINLGQEELTLLVVAGRIPLVSVKPPA
jgi:mannose-6-phosphate isomerase-like protein (cupin superfamily)